MIGEYYAFTATDLLRALRASKWPKYGSEGDIETCIILV
jgi:hypothetical protein